MSYCPGAAAKSWGGMPCPGAAGAGGHSKCAVLPHAVIQAVANLQGNAILRS